MTIQEHAARQFPSDPQSFEVALLAGCARCSRRLTDGIQPVSNATVVTWTNGDAMLSVWAYCSPCMEVMKRIHTIEPLNP